MVEGGGRDHRARRAALRGLDRQGRLRGAVAGRRRPGRDPRARGRHRRRRAPCWPSSPTVPPLPPRRRHRPNPPPHRRPAAAAPDGPGRSPPSPRTAARAVPAPAPRHRHRRRRRPTGGSSAPAEAAPPPRRRGGPTGRRRHGGNGSRNGAERQPDPLPCRAAAARRARPRPGRGPGHGPRRPDHPRRRPGPDRRTALRRGPGTAPTAATAAAAPVPVVPPPTAAPAAAGAARPPTPTPATTVARAGTDEIVPFTNIRRRTAEHMVRSKATSPHTLVVLEADYENVERVRRAHGAAVQGRGGLLAHLPALRGPGLCRGPARVARSQLVGGRRRADRPPPGQSRASPSTSTTRA